MIKFRGKSVFDAGRLVGDWVYGSLVIDEEWGRYYIYQKELVSGFYRIEKYEVNSESIGMFTGLKNKNDKEIYGSIEIGGKISKGGDIYKDKIHGLRVIEYSDKLACFMSYLLKDKTLGNPLHFENRAEIEIIGNIYENENPELIGEKDNEKI